ncbi:MULTISPECIES: HNH endonuclease signature motif containing protein [Pseudomonas putida group]|uniref:HNH endonuclease signature motif containing protein n=1 Tax=Pseudomonas putida group TaxID=136845 RepID=UPI0018AC49B0|nr:HNH endonuclease signature motif containing protein [Pseudomonas fulva]MBF8776305.1 HNH endonuclease [Pseudomonas fulva]
MSSADRDFGLGASFLERLVKEPKIYEPGDLTAFVPIGRYSLSPGWCFLPWKGLEGAYKWGFKARPEISDYFSALAGLQKTFLTDEKADFQVIRKGKKVWQSQPRARWRDGGARPNLLRPWGWFEVDIEKLEALGYDHSKGAVLDLWSGGEHFTDRPISVRNFQAFFSLGTFALWGERCVLTGSTLALEAAHLKPVESCEDDDPALSDPYNGIVLTASLHRLMDDGFWGFDPHGNVVIDPKLSTKEREIHQLAVTRKVEFHPKAEKYLQFRIMR